jgi:hypothetical protein
MKKIVWFLPLLFLSISLFGQNGTLQIFSDEPVIVYIDQVQTPNYSSISLVAGTHYVKALNVNEERITVKLLLLQKTRQLQFLLKLQKMNPLK